MTMLHLGIDLGSKTVKLVVLDDDKKLLESSYERHLSNVPATLSYRVHMLARVFPNEEFSIGVTGSAGMQLAGLCGLHFDQEVIATRAAIGEFIPQTDVAIEIGGEDSKIIYIAGGQELRMNNTCAGGTGGFIDTIAGMLDIHAEELNTYAYGSKHVYPIASRCAVFAQSDVRPLINEGVSKEDIAASTFNAVVSQCIGGLACGREIRGKVAFLGGPLHFLSYLRECFVKRLNIAPQDVIAPPEGHLFIAQGAALLGWNEKPMTLAELIEKINAVPWDEYTSLNRLNPLFESKEEYQQFVEDHADVGASRVPLGNYEGDAYLGVDSGSEAIKYVLMGEHGEVLRAYYKRSAGDVIDAAKEMLVDLWKSIPRNIDGSPMVKIRHATVTGYGEGYLKQAFAFDSGEVETVAHVWAAKSLVPDVDFLLDIGGQDIKCTYLHNGNIQNVVLNEACSSGCGALLSGMAWNMNIKIQDFVHEALFAKSPVDLGTRCTVFMTSRVRHAQKEGAELGDIAAGLAYSVVRNAVQKVIRVNDASDLGKNIVVQGGTFANDAVLRAFEKFYNVHVTRPIGAETMGAYGAALLARERAVSGAYSTLLEREEVESLNFKQDYRVCELCTNACHLTVTTFEDSTGAQRTYTVGNRCDRGAGITDAKQLPDMFDIKYKLLFADCGAKEDVKQDAARGTIGIPRVLNFYDSYPFWKAFFTNLGFEVELSSESSEEIFRKGIEYVPSESMCFPAKLAFGHVQDLVDKGVEKIFLPYVLGSRCTDDSCPVLGAYPLAIKLNVESLQEHDVSLITPMLNGLFDPNMRGSNIDALVKSLHGQFEDVTREEVERAFDAGFAEDRIFGNKIRKIGRRLLQKVRDEKLPAVILVGRPCHLDPMLHHGIPSMLTENGNAVLTEDALNLVDEQGTPWGYASTTVAAAETVVNDDDLDFVELHSFNCGPDAMTTDMVQDIMDRTNRPYACLKIDEMVDVASSRIRVRSMIAARNQMKLKQS